MGPIQCVWTGDAYQPTPRHLQAAREQHGAGEVLTMVALEERSDKTHNHEFAFVGEAWKTLPETVADEFPTPEHLRKRALIATGFYHETIIDVGTLAGALRVASYVRSSDDFAHVVTRGGVVVVRKAKSQSRKAMGKADFQTSKTAILEWISNLLNVEAKTLEEQAA